MYPVKQILVVILALCTKWTSDLSYLKISLLLNMISKSQSSSGYLMGIRFICKEAK